MNPNTFTTDSAFGRRLIMLDNNKTVASRHLERNDLIWTGIYTSAMFLTFLAGAWAYLRMNGVIS